jgi:hypothetical protein
MVVLVPTRFAVLLAAAFLFVSGCVGGPNLPRVVQVQEGQRTTVRLIQFSNGQAMSLQNASSGSAGEVYSKDTSNPFAKVIKDAQLQALLDVLADKGMYSADSASVPPDARDALLVDQGSKRWVLYRRHAGMQQDELPFHEAKSYFLSVWNGATAYHTGNPDLKGENDRVRAEAEAARRKLLEIQRKQGTQGKQQ